MKQVKKNTLFAVVFLTLIAFTFSSCYESHYYHHYNHHTRGWYDRHHTPPPAGVNFDVDIHR
jgi:hypothetical protein